MGFRDDFISGYVLAPSGPHQRTFAQWSLENTVDSGLRANQQQLRALGLGIRSAFEAGIDRLAESQAQSAKLLQAELQQQADHIVEAIERGSADVVSAVQQACDYLGGQLCEVRWAIERQTQTAQQILEALLTSLDVTSRQYYTQGVRCYESSEYDLAKERFNRALDANRTNYFAYQYLGFIAVNANDSQAAINNFNLARKFAENDFYRALAHSHLSRSLTAIHNEPEALEHARAAAEAAPKRARFWYELAVCYVRLGRAEHASKSLRSAIEADWNYWSISTADSSLDPIRATVDALLDTMRDEQRATTRRALNGLREALTYLRSIAIDTEIADDAAKLDQGERLFRESNVFSYRIAAPLARTAHEHALSQSVKILDERIKANRSQLHQFQVARRGEVASLRNEAGKLNGEARWKAESYKGKFGCLQVVAIVGFGLGGASALAQRNEGLGVFLIVLAAFFLFMHPIFKLFQATLPASDLRAQASRKEREAESLSESAERMIADETKRYDNEAGQLNAEKQACEQRLKELLAGAVPRQASSAQPL
jgi:tetratricopeptide (TPR) repeat protein